MRPSLAKWPRFSLVNCWTRFPARPRCWRSSGRPAVLILVNRLFLRSRCLRPLGRESVSSSEMRLPTTVSLLILWYEAMLFVEAKEKRSKVTNWGNESDVISFEKLIIVLFLV